MQLSRSESTTLPESPASVLVAQPSVADSVAPEEMNEKPKPSDFAMLASDDGWAFHSSVYD